MEKIKTNSQEEEKEDLLVRDLFVVASPSSSPGAGFRPLNHTSFSKTNHNSGRNTETTF